MRVRKPAVSPNPAQAPGGMPAGFGPRTHTRSLSVAPGAAPIQARDPPTPVVTYRQKSSPRLVCSPLETAGTTPDLLEDGVCGGGPQEGRRAGVIAVSQYASRAAAAALSWPLPPSWRGTSGRASLMLASPRWLLRPSPTARRSEVPPRHPLRVRGRREWLRRSPRVRPRTD